jgi:hypothetical protein
VALFYLDASSLVKLVSAERETDPLRASLRTPTCARAIDLSPIDAFVSYDEHQSADARLAGLHTVDPQPGNCKPAFRATDRRGWQPIDTAGSPAHPQEHQDHHAPAGTTRRAIIASPPRRA